MEKTALITGAGSGLGRGFALALARRGYHLFLVGRDASRLKGVAGEIGKFTTASLHPADLADPLARSQLVDSLLSQGDAPALLVNNAAVMPAGSYLQRPLAEIESALILNLIAPAVLTRCLCGSPSPPAGVIFVLSSAARFPQPYNSPYSASKAGLRFLAESLQVELAGKTRVCLAYPPLMATPMTGAFGMSRWPISKADPLRVAEQILSAYEAGRSEITWFDWEALPGLFYRLFPGLFRRVLKSQRHSLQGLFAPFKSGHD